MSTLRRHILVGGFLGYGPLVVVVLLTADCVVDGGSRTVSWWVPYVVVWLLSGLTYGWLRWLLRGPEATDGPETRERMVVRAIGAGVGAQVLMLPLWLLTFCAPGHIDGWRRVDVSARLVSVDGRPVADARVLALRFDEDMAAFDGEAAWSEWRHAEEVEGADRGAGGHDGRLGCRTGPLGATSDENGRLDVTLCVWWWGSGWGPARREGAGDPRESLSALWIAVPERETVVVPVPPDAWRETDEPSDTEVWRTYDLGILVVP